MASAEKKNQRSMDRIKRKQLIRVAEGYLDLIMVFDDRWPLDMPLRRAMADQVIESLSKIKSPMGHKPYILFLKGQACRTCDRFKDAINYLQQASRLDQDNIHTFLALAWCYKRVDRMDLAIEAMETAVMLDESSCIAHYNLACYWSLAGERQNAILHLSRALELNPDYRNNIATETDFDNIRDDNGFLALTTLIA